MLGLDFAYARCPGGTADSVEEELQLGEPQECYASRQDFAAVARASLEAAPDGLDDTSRQQIGGETLSIVLLRLGLRGQTGQIAVGCRRTGFPDDIEKLLLNAAAEHATSGLQAAQWLSEQKQLRAREQQTRQVLENIPAFVVVLSSSGEIEGANAQTLRYFGKTLAELRTWTTADMIHPEDLARTLETFGRSIETGVAYDIEQRLRGPEGAYRWFRANGIPLTAGDGRIERWYVLLIDIEETKRVEERLRERERQLRQSAAIIAEGQRLSQTGTFYWNTVTNELQFSDENCRINGIEVGTPITMELMASRIHPDDQWLIQHKIEANRNNLNELEYEIRLQMPDKQVKWVYTTASRFVNEAGHLEYIGAVRDITERHNAEEALSRLRSELAHIARVSTLGALTASIAHEVNQPLAGIITNASTGLRMLSADPPNVSGALETARRTIRDANRASDVIARLRNMFSRKETVRERFSLNEAAQEVIGLALSELQRNSLTLETQLAADLPVVYGDRVQLQQVILNLLLNASDAMKEVVDRAREILLKTEVQHDGAVRLTVADSGTGIDPVHAERLFEAFYTTKKTGMGMGLSISRSIIERHGGRLWVEPNADQGASFSFCIP